MKVIDLVAQTFGKLIVLRQSGSRGGCKIWECRCACGGMHYSTTTALRRGQVKSCGCLRHETMPGLRHGMAGSRTWLSWSGMRHRCAGKDMHAPRYSEKGIAYDPAWDSFERFLADMGERPIGMTLDRINNALGYSKANCRWATVVEQNRNRDSNRIIEWRGTLYPLVELAQFGCVSAETLGRRLSAGWDIEVALSKPSKRRNAPRRLGQR